MSNDLFKRNCAVLAQWYAGECKDVLEFKCDGDWLEANGCSPDVSEYRIKPRTITVNGIEVPEPVREPLKDGQEYFTITISNPSSLVIEARWRGEGDKTDIYWLKLGLIHLTKESAQLHAEAMIQPSKRDES